MLIPSFLSNQLDAAAQLSLSGRRRNRQVGNNLEFNAGAPFDCLSSQVKIFAPKMAGHRNAITGRSGRIKSSVISREANFSTSSHRQKDPTVIFVTCPTVPSRHQDAPSTEVLGTAVMPRESDGNQEAELNRLSLWGLYRWPLRLQRYPMP
jgi:hypothetical protein